MRTTIDRAGRVVVPKVLRQAIGLEPGAEIELTASDGRIELEPAPLDVRLERRGALLVADSEGAMLTLNGNVLSIKFAFLDKYR